MESENRNKAKFYVLSYSDGRIPAKVVHGWPAVMAERERAANIKVNAKGFHTQEVAVRYLNNMISGTVTFQNAEKKLQIVVKTESI